MKLNKYIWLAALPMIFTACQEDMLVENSSKQGITTLSATMGNDADSRAQIELGTYPGTFMWNEGDAFTLFESDADNNVTKKEFAISETYSDESPSKKADFSSENALTVGSSFVAYYPSFDIPYAHVDNDDEVAGQYYFCHPGYFQIQCEYVEDGDGYLTYDEITTWKKYFQQYMYMKADGTVTAEGAKVSFEHLCGIVRITYTNKTNSSQNIKDICVDGSWGTTAFISETSTDIDKFYDNQEGLRLSFDLITVDPDQSKEFYILFFPPHNVQGQSINPLTKIGVSHDSNQTNPQYIYTPQNYNNAPLSVSGFEAGHTYWFNITEIGDGNEESPYSLVWTADLEGDNEEGEQPGDSENTEDEEGYTLVDSYETLQQAVIDQKTAIRLADNIALQSPLNITVPTTLDLNKWTLGLAESINYQNKGGDAVLNYSGNGELKILNGNLSTNTSTTPLHRYYVNVTPADGSVYFNSVQLTTGTAVTNAISADYHRVELQNCQIETNGYAIHWECDNVNTRFSSVLQNSTIVGDICYNTNKSKDLDRTDNVSIYSCTITGNLVTSLPTGVTRADIFEVDKYSSAKDKDGNKWNDVGEAIYCHTIDVSDWDGLKAAFEAEKTINGNVVISLADNTDIELLHPLTVERHVDLQLNGSTLTVSKDFVWNNENSVFTVNNNQNQGEFYIYNGTFVGPSELNYDNKYFFSGLNTNAYSFQNVIVNAVKIPTALYMKNGTCSIYNDDDSDIISSIKGNYAFEADSEGAFAVIKCKVEGNVKLTSSSRFKIEKGSIAGILNKDATSSIDVSSGVIITNDPNNTWSIEQ